jgi:hypothetical protein
LDSPLPVLPPLGHQTVVGSSLVVTLSHTHKPSLPSMTEDSSL